MSSVDNFSNPEKDNQEGEWIKVGSRKRKEKKYIQQEQKIRALRHYWNGFDNQGKERWYIELSNGVIISNSNKEYDNWIKRYYPNNKYN